MQKLKMIPCPKCGTDFPELRKTLYNYHVCVNCSTTKPVVGITTVEGSGDHTYNDIIINLADNKKTANLWRMDRYYTCNYRIRINFYLLVSNQALLISLYLQEPEHSSLNP